MVAPIQIILPDANRLLVGMRNHTRQLARNEFLFAAQTHFSIGFDLNMSSLGKGKSGALAMGRLFGRIPHCVHTNTNAICVSFCPYGSLLEQFTCHLAHISKLLLQLARSWNVKFWSLFSRPLRRQLCSMMAADNTQFRY